jgi:exopolysaccharide biosynthesis polyprenyl glycosylphosphotransferase
MSQRIETHWMRLVNRVLDFAAFAGAFMLGYATREAIDNHLHPESHVRYLPDTGLLLALFLIFYAVNLLSLSLHSVYPMSRLRRFQDAVKLYVRCVASATVWLMVPAFLAHPIGISRLFLVASAGYALILLIVKEGIIRALLIRWRVTGANLRFAVVVGKEEEVSAIARAIETHHHIGVRVKGFVLSAPSPTAEIEGRPVLASIAGFTDLIEREVIDCAVFAAHDRLDQAMQSCMWDCEQRGVEVWMTLGFAENELRTVELEHLQPFSFVTLRRGPKNNTALMIKELFDRSAALVLLVILLPIIVLIAVLITATSAGPVFFCQHRAGINGRKFVFLKFRSMVSNAEELKDALRHRNEMSGPVFKIADDPRITSLGKFLRKTSLDELPQLINVLRGEMSLVGPRPLPVAEAARIRGRNRRRLSMKPGITCIWQVSGRNRIKDFDEWAQLDLKYIDEWSLWLDLKILLKTIPAVLRGSGV